MASSDLAPWRSPLSRALHRNRAQPFCRFLQLATVRLEGAPANRTVVFRGFRSESNQLMFICDRRSEKIAQIQQNPNAEACWYFAKTREQFRLRGQLTAITTDASTVNLLETRRQLWQKISDKARLQFAWPQPKIVRDQDSSAFTPSQPDSQVPLDTFCALLLAPEEVDYLCLRGEPQDRTVYRLFEESWTATTVNP